MPRTYVPNPRGVRHQQHSVEELENALTIIASGKSIRSVSRDLNIPFSVLQRFHKNRQQNPNFLPKKLGGQISLPECVEKALVENILKCSNWGYPITEFELRMFVKYHLDRVGTKIAKFKDNRPGYDWAKLFLKRHKQDISQRMCQNIKRSRAAVTNKMINDYFDNLTPYLKDISPDLIINYDETNLSDDPGRKRIICKRGTKYPERIMNFTKSATSVMFAAAADGTLLPPYIIYKSMHLYDKWTEGGPRGARYNRTPSGWMDGRCFLEWFIKIIVPYCKCKEGRKILIGDNLSSHISPEVIKLCNKYQIDFILLPPNSTHITQPLDIAFFRPLKGSWRKVLDDWKSNKKSPSVDKSTFPSLLKSTIDKLNGRDGDVIRAGFEKSGIWPLNRDRVLNTMLPKDDQFDTSSEIVENNLTMFLKESRFGESAHKKTRKSRLKVPAGKSVRAHDLESSESEISEDDNLLNQTFNDENDNEIDQSSGNDTIIEPTQSTSSGNRGVINMPINVLQTNIEEGTWVAVNFGKNKPKIFFGKVVSVIKKGEMYEGSFTRPSLNIKNLDKCIHAFPEVIDFCEFSIIQVIRILKNPKLLRRGRWEFDENLKSVQEEFEKKK